MIEGQPIQMNFGLTGIDAPHTLNSRGDIRMPDEATGNANPNPSNGPEQQGSAPRQEGRRTGRRGGQESDGKSELETKIDNIFSDQDLARELHSETPDLNPNRSPKLKDLADLIDEFDPADTTSIPYLANYISTPDRRIGDGSLTISDTSKEVIFEWIVEKIIKLPDISPDSHYRISDLYMSQNLTTLKNLAASNRFTEMHGDEEFEGTNEFGRYIGELIEIRETAHELRRNLSQGENYKKFIQEGLKSGGLDFMRNKLAGAAEINSLYEMYTARMVSQRKKWLSSEDVLEIDKQVTLAARKLWESGQIKKGERPITKWEVDRALQITKTLFAGTQRFAMYTSLGNVPPGAEARIGSLPYEYIVRSLATYKATAVRFFYDKGNVAFHKRILNHLAKDGDISKTRTLYGVSPESWIVNGKGGPDPLSHGWRSGLVFLGDISVKDAEGHNVTLLDYVDGIMLEEHTKAGLDYDPTLGFNPEEKKEEKIKVDVTKKIRDRVLGQTMYLSTFVRDGRFSGFKDLLWRKLAVYDPMTIASLRPETIDALKLTDAQKKIWEGLVDKLAMANVVRLKTEGRKYFDEEGNQLPQDTQELTAEARRFSDTSINDKLPENVRYQILSKYFGEQFGNNLSPEEAALLRRVIDEAINQAREISGFKDKNGKKQEGIELPFTMVINDAPHIAWAKNARGGGNADEDVFRLMLSDQAALAEGWGAINSLVENPPEKAEEAFVTAVQKWASVRGRETAQKELEPFLLAWLDMSSQNRLAEWLSSTMRDAKIPRSEMEKYFQSSFLSTDELDRSVFLEKLAQEGAISSDVSGGRFHVSQLEKLKKKSRASRHSLLWRLFRMWVQSLTANVILELPKSALKDAGGVLKAA